MVLDEARVHPRLDAILDVQLAGRLRNEDLGPAGKVLQELPAAIREELAQPFLDRLTVSADLDPLDAGVEDVRGRRQDVELGSLDVEIHEIDPGMRRKDLFEGDARHHLGLKTVLSRVGDIHDGLAIARRRLSDEETHGTAVAGIIAAHADDGLGIAGIAPEARLLALRACWPAAASGEIALCSSFTLAKALQFALEEKAQVINLSLGGPRDRLLERLLDTALSRGITIVGAANPDVGDGGFPASHRGVLAVAGDDGHDVAGDILLAPGRDIPTTLVDQKWGFVTGSSFAAAHVTGLVALLRELAPELRPQQLRDALAPPMAPGAAADRHVIVDACGAVGKATGTCACACTAARDSPPPR